VGGGAILDEENRRRLGSLGVVVWLQTDAETLWKRIREDQRSPATRPALSNDDEREEIKALLLYRQAIYRAAADRTVDTTRYSPDEVAAMIAAGLDSRRD
jgi:shikimate kinase